LPEVEVQLGTKVVRPDASGWRRERLPSPWGMRPITVVPDWICEALSPSNEGHDRVYKANLYAGASVAFYWILDPAERILEALELRDGGWIRIGAWTTGETARVRPFDAIELEIDRLFPPP
jgi:Uma2 family endonuclease